MLREPPPTPGPPAIFARSGQMQAARFPLLSLPDQPQAARTLGDQRQSAKSFRPIRSTNIFFPVGPKQFCFTLKPLRDRYGNV